MPEAKAQFFGRLGPAGGQAGGWGERCGGQRRGDVPVA
jgi:hypothetical protein